VKQNYAGLNCASDNYIHIYIYIYMCVCVCVCIFLSFLFALQAKQQFQLFSFKFSHLFALKQCDKSETPAVESRRILQSKR
jgi:hypothetical protein